MAAAILLVEDDPVLGPLLVSMLGTGGHRAVRLAADAPEALAAAGELGRDLGLLITDIGLPTSPGHRLAETLQERSPDLRVLLITGHSDERARSLGIPASWRVLEKPFTVEALLGAVKAALDDA